MTDPHRLRQSHGTGEFHLADFSSLGEGVIFEPGVLVVHKVAINLYSTAGWHLHQSR